MAKSFNVATDNHIVEKSEKFIKNVRKTIKTPPPPTPRLPIIPLKKPPSIRIKKSNAFTL